MAFLDCQIAFAWIIAEWVGATHSVPRVPRCTEIGVTGTLISYAAMTLGFEDMSAYPRLLSQVLRGLEQKVVSVSCDKPEEPFR